MHIFLGEDLATTAIREVKEETGIDTEFESLLAFRHMHNANFGCSDLYFIVVLKPKSHILKMCKHELADCQWMKVCCLFSSLILKVIIKARGKTKRYQNI